MFWLVFFFSFFLHHSHHHYHHQQQQQQQQQHRSIPPTRAHLHINLLHQHRFSTSNCSCVHPKTQRGVHHRSSSTVTAPTTNHRPLPSSQNVFRYCAFNSFIFETYSFSLDIITGISGGGRGGPLVLLLHGWPESWYSWRHQLQMLKHAGYHAVAPDMRGYGGTGAQGPMQEYNIYRLAGE